MRGKNARPSRMMQLFKLYQNTRKAYHLRLRKRQRQLQQYLRAHGNLSSRRRSPSLSLSSLSSLTSDSDSTEGSNSETGSSSNSSTDTTSTTGSDSSTSSLESDSDDADSVGQGSVGNETDGDGDDEDSELDNDEDVSENRWKRLRNWISGEIDNMFINRYEVSRHYLPRGPSRLHHVLHELKHQRTDLFRQELRVNPTTFDALVARLASDEVFSNNSINAQMPVEEQVAIMLYRFGHDGNAASLQSVANWASVGKGTITLCTRRVLTALLRLDFREETVRFPTPEEKEEAKHWVEDHSCRAWRGGWCLVDGTLIPLYAKPHWYGESYFDRKCRYSLNVQVVSLPNLRIIDFSIGHVGSTHDSTAWESTRLAQEYNDVLEDGEWVWADSAYPINTWIVAPYKKPERDLPDNEVFNNHVSMVRIRSEHAIGFLKGRFPSLKNLRVDIRSSAGHKFATFWIVGCICTHTFATEHEAKERAEMEHDGDMVADPFIMEGLSDTSGSESGSDREISGLAGRRTYGRLSTNRLRAAKACREKLKACLFHAKAKRRNQRRRQRRAALQVDTDSDMDISD